MLLSRLSIAFTLLCANRVHSLATPILPGGISLVEYIKLLTLCEDGGEDTYVGLRFGDDDYTTFNFDAFYPYTIGTKVAQQAVFCKAATCVNHPNEDCTGGATPPVPITVPKFTTLVNVADFVHLLGQSATCSRNILSINDM